MTLIEKLAKKDPHSISFSFEITPPLRGIDIGGVSKTIEKLLPFDPLWIDITSHAPDVDWVKADTPELFEKKVQKKRPGTISICAALQFKYGVDCVPHLLCRGFSIEETEDSLIDLHYLGIKNILAIRGDGTADPAHEQLHTSKSHDYATDLLQQISHLHEGIYLHQKAEPMKFCTGVSFYPEKHFESPNQGFDMEILQKKVKLGAQYGISQMFFNNSCFLDYVERAQAIAPIPLITGIKILTHAKQLSMVPSRFFVDIPETFSQQMFQATDPKDQRQCGIDWAFDQCVDLIDNGHTHLHFYILQNAGPLKTLMQRLQKRYPNRITKKISP